MNENTTPEKIVVHYDNGTTKEIGHGLVFHVVPGQEPDTVEVTAELVAVGEDDLRQIIGAAVELGFRIGLFKEDEGEATPDESTKEDADDEEG